jgi:hypothetical protein
MTPAATGNALKITDKNHRKNLPKVKECSFTVPVIAPG